MSEFRNFVSEFEIDQEKKRRQEEWERVRRPDQPREAPEPEVDTRPLYVRLREQREKAQLEFDEAMKLKHSVRGLDDDELEFIEQVDRIRSEMDRKIRSEEQEVIQAVRQAMVSPVSNVSNVSVGNACPKRAASNKVQSKQATLLAGAIRRKVDGQKPVRNKSSVATEEHASASISTDGKTSCNEPVKDLQAGSHHKHSSPEKTDSSSVPSSEDKSDLQFPYSNHADVESSRNDRGRKRPLEPESDPVEAPKR
ncbi:NEFA-interacting nuclear protein NIP30 [Trichuris trichiura]|uniref:NEFA-interacting nuclear protein NIP30 n=1 Tax=Trichuris trichiura TaxID=36087 RepID=A0A077ZDJ2_TRITR|nr:NEFA-interacting nuclear protein NIP30 [Trichuris trichiura]